MQVFLQQIKNSLNQNPNLKEPEDFKEDLFRLIQTMCERAKIYHINLKRSGLLVERLKTLTIEGGSKLVNPAPYCYDVKSNKVVINPDQIEDVENIFCQTILEMVLVKEPEKGIDEKNNTAIKRGTLEILANNLVGNNGEKQIFEDEQIVVNLMNCITKGQLLDSILTGNNEMLEKVIQEYRLEVTRDYANYNLVYRQQHKIPMSELPHIEQNLIRIFFRRATEKNCYSEEDIKTFTSLLVCDARVMGSPEKYRELSRVAVCYQFEKEQYERGLQQNRMQSMLSDSMLTDNVVTIKDYLGQTMEQEDIKII